MRTIMRRAIRECYAFIGWQSPIHLDARSNKRIGALFCESIIGRTNNCQTNHISQIGLNENRRMPAVAGNCRFYPDFIGTSSGLRKKQCEENTRRVLKVGDFPHYFGCEFFIPTEIESEKMNYRSFLIYTLETRFRIRHGFDWK